MPYWTKELRELLWLKRVIDVVLDDISKDFFLVSNEVANRSNGRWKILGTVVLNKNICR